MHRLRNLNATACHLRRVSSSGRTEMARCRWVHRVPSYSRLQAMLNDCSNHCNSRCGDAHRDAFQCRDRCLCDAIHRSRSYAYHEQESRLANQGSRESSLVAQPSGRSRSGQRASGSAASCAGAANLSGLRTGSATIPEGRSSRRLGAGAYGGPTRHRGARLTASGGGRGRARDR